jgi:S1-C subfamily serine protease
MKWVAVLGTLGLAFALASAEGSRLRRRIAELERAPRVAPEEVERLRAELARVRAEVEAGAERAAADRRVERIDSTLARHGAALDERACEIAEQRERLRAWEELWLDREPQRLERELADVRGGLERSSRDLLAQIESSTRAEARERERLERMVEPLTRPRDTAAMWRELVAPVVQLSGASTVGSGVVVEPRGARAAGGARYLLTSWHVVRDIYGSTDRTHEPVPVKLYEADGTTRTTEAHMLVYDVALDAALLELAVQSPPMRGAQLASLERLRDVRVFDAVYAVGCPLGNDPIPTAGEVASVEHVVDGSTYWMISAPTYIGNSGGGIYDARTHELIGIFSKIYTHGSSRTTIVPHMGLVTPLYAIYDWLERAGYASLLLETPPREAQTASAAR